ncbi:MAG: hypothetical protein MUE84_17110, partial [Hyphomonas sp.]|nr:hypothetical protein [Hyphomonas sp.]
VDGDGALAAIVALRDGALARVERRLVLLARRPALADVVERRQPLPRPVESAAKAPLEPLLERRIDSIDPIRLHEALRGRLDYSAQQALDRLVPAQFNSPAGTSHAIDYEDPGGPSVELRVQALFGMDRQPTFGDPPQPLLLKLTDPGGKPLQTTRDLPGFWRGSWKDVQRDMKGRYPKHRWPDAPWTEAPSLKTKNAFNRS